MGGGLEAFASYRRRSEIRHRALGHGIELRIACNLSAAACARVQHFKTKMWLPISFEHREKLRPRKIRRDVQDI